VGTVFCGVFCGMLTMVCLRLTAHGTRARR
jgi:hypothetical protein